jgi:hypothetical protein
VLIGITVLELGTRLKCIVRTVLKLEKYGICVKKSYEKLFYQIKTELDRRSD